MMQREEIELSPIEATAYWWINTIRYKVREIAISGARSTEEAQFAEIFYEYTERDWRKLYLELVEYISEDVDDYIPKDHLDSFSQDTDIKGHERLNDELSKIIGQSIFDIRLAGNDVKDSVIYTTTTFASVWYKSCGVNKLSTKYEPSYILTGDNKSLDFYNLLISTIAILEKEDSNFTSVSLLRKRFCSEYMKLSAPDKTLKDVMELFNFSFDKASVKGIILGRSFKEIYFPTFKEIDYVGLDSYMDLATHYANVVLEKVQDSDEIFSRILKNPNNTN